MFKNLFNPLNLKPYQFHLHYTVDIQHKLLIMISYWTQIDVYFVHIYIFSLILQKKKNVIYTRISNLYVWVCAHLYHLL